MTTEIYLDANATSPVLPAAAAAADQAMRERFGNPSSTHATGIKAKALLDATRRRAARVLGTGDGRLLFTSGATESIQTAVLSALCAVRERRERGEAVGSLLVYGATEHKAVPESLAHWNRLLGLNLTLRALPVDGDGQHDLQALRVLAQDAALVCTMAANNESGVVSDLRGIEAVLADSPAYWMVDSVQALGKMELNLAATRIDYAPFSGHKLYAPKGVGMLYVRAGSPYTPLMAGGGQESGQRAGTENMAGIAALGAVLAALEDGRTFRSHPQLVAFRKRIADALSLALPGVVFNTPFEKSLPTTINFSVPGLAGKELLDVFDAAGVRVSSGSACSSAKAAPSYVLEAMGLEPWRCAAAVRMSFGPAVDEAFIAAACARIAHCGEALRRSYLIASEQPKTGDDGVIQFSVDGANTWLLTDAASGTCIIIDPREELSARIASHLRCQQYRVQAILTTHGDAPRPSPSAHLQRFVADRYDGADMVDALGWPVAGDSIALGNGSQAGVVNLGSQVLVRLPQQDGASYLLGHRSAAGLAAQDVRFAFTGNAPLPGGVTAAQPLGALRNAVQNLAALVNRDTILCAARDDNNQICSSIGAESRGHGPIAELLAVQPRLARPALPAMDTVMHLEAHALVRFLATHPDAIVVDVRETYEHAAGAMVPAGASGVVSVPLSRLAFQLSGWLRGEQRPLVFFCRSGARSLRAAQCLHRLGYQNAWHMVGGVALSDTMLALAA